MRFVSGNLYGVPHAGPHVTKMGFLKAPCTRFALFDAPESRASEHWPPEHGTPEPWGAPAPWARDIGHLDIVHLDVGHMDMGH